MCSSTKEECATCSDFIWSNRLISSHSLYYWRRVQMASLLVPLMALLTFSFSPQPEAQIAKRHWLRSTVWRVVKEQNRTTLDEHLLRRLRSETNTAKSSSDPSLRLHFNISSLVWNHWTILRRLWDKTQGFYQDHDTSCCVCCNQSFFFFFFAKTWQFSNPNQVVFVPKQPS